MRADILLAFAAASLAASQARAQNPQLELITAAMSDYVWRGALAAAGPVSQSSAGVEWRGIALRAWQNIDLTADRKLRGKISEADYDVSYTRPVREFGISAGAVRYTFPHAGMAATTELYTGVSAPGRLHPSMRAFFDVEAFHGAYLTFDTAHRFAMPAPVKKIVEGLDLSAGAGWGSADYHRAYFGLARSGFSDLHPAASLPIRITGSVRLTPSLAYSMMLDPHLRQTAPAFHGFILGVTLSVRPMRRPPPA